MRSLLTCQKCGHFMIQMQKQVINKHLFLMMLTQNLKPSDHLYLSNWQGFHQHFYRDKYLNFIVIQQDYVLFVIIYYLFPFLACKSQKHYLINILSVSLDLPCVRSGLEHYHEDCCRKKNSVLIKSKDSISPDAIYRDLSTHQLACPIPGICKKLTQLWAAERTGIL